MSFKNEAMDYILESAKLLTRRADEIVCDLDDEMVNEVYITIRITGHDAPSLEIEKSYVPIGKVV